MRLVFKNFETYREAALGWGLEFTQLDRGAFQGSLHQIAGPRVWLTHFDLNRQFFQQGTIHAPGRTFGLFLDRVSPMLWRNSPLVDADTIVAFPPDGTLEALSFPGFDAVSVSVDQAFLETVSQQEELERSLEALPNCAARIRTDRKIMAALRNAIRSLFDASVAAVGDRYRRAAETDVARLIIKAVDVGDHTVAPPCRRKRDRAFAAALELIDASLSPLTIPDICSQVGASERTLRYAFRERLGVSPKRYLTVRRMAAVRKRLLAKHEGGSPVQDIASQLGYWHTGQFAADYKAMFGELPSDTLKRATA